MCGRWLGEVWVGGGGVMGWGLGEEIRGHNIIQAGAASKAARP